jgi:glutathione S-transferase
MTSDTYALYYSPGSCALIVNCLLHELEVPFELKRVDVEAREHHGAAYRKLNPKGKVPVLVTPEGPLTECLAIIEHVCDRHDVRRQWLPEPAGWERAKALERLATLSTEVHNNLASRFFHADAYSDDAAVQAEVKAGGAARLLEYFRAQDATLSGPYWSGGAAPDASDLYFMVVARWGRWLEPSALELPRIGAFFRRMVERPAVARAMAGEGIKPFGT